MIRLAAVVVFGATIGVSSSTRAEPCVEAIAAEKAATLRRSLVREAERLESWRLSWTAIFAAGVIGQIAIGGLFEGDDRRTFDVGAVKAGLGAVTTPFLAPRIAVPDPIVGESPCASLIRLRAALVVAGRREAKGVSWFQHLPGVAVNVAGILYLGLVHDLWIESLLGAAFGTVVGETKLWTQPRRAIGWAEGAEPTSPSPWISRVRIGGGPLQMTLTIDF